MPTHGKTWKWKKEKLANHITAKKYQGIDRGMIMYFRWARWRGISGYSKSFYWPSTREGVLAFAAELGPIPKKIKRPSVGRIDHNKGYVPGNIRWEEFNINSGIHARNQHRLRQYEEDIPF